MGASPIYTRRMRKTLRFEGDDVSTIMKGLQLDVGFAHQYYDIGWEVESKKRGAFWVNSCGALMDVEPRGEDIVVMVCHDIEDPTFDATAVATNPCARIRPIHRPPRQPVGRVPHCHWINEVYFKPAKKMLDDLYAKGLLDSTRFFDERLEVEYYELWHHEGRRARMGAAMMAPDYSWWHGFYECKARFNNYMEGARDLIKHNKKAYKATDYPNATGSTKKPIEVLPKKK